MYTWCTVAKIVEHGYLSSNGRDTTWNNQLLCLLITADPLHLLNEITLLNETTLLNEMTLAAFTLNKVSTATLLLIITGTQSYYRQSCFQ